MNSKQVWLKTKDYFFLKKTKDPLEDREEDFLFNTHWNNKSIFSNNNNWAIMMEDPSLN